MKHPVSWTAGMVILLLCFATSTTVSLISLRFSIAATQAAELNDLRALAASFSRGFNDQWFAAGQAAELLQGHVVGAGLPNATVNATGTALRCSVPIAQPSLNFSLAQMRSELSTRAKVQALEVWPQGFSCAGAPVTPRAKNWTSAIIGDARNTRVSILSSATQRVILSVPVYCISLSAVRALANPLEQWWGNVAVIVDVEAMVRAARLDAVYAAADASFVLTRTAGDISTAVANLSSNADDTMGSGIRTTVSLDSDVTTTSSRASTWHLYSQLNAPTPPYARNKAVPGAVLGCFLAAMVVATCVIVISRLCVNCLAPEDCVPRRVPFAVIATEIVDAADMFESSPAAAAEVGRTTVAAIRELAELRRCHVAQLIADGVVITAMDCEQAILLAEDLAGWASTVELPETALINGQQVAYRLRIVVHWCTTGRVTTNMKGHVSYSGDDVELAAAVRSICPSGCVTITEPAFRVVCDANREAADCFFHLGQALVATDQDRALDAYVLATEAVQDVTDIPGDEVSLWQGGAASMSMADAGVSTLSEADGEGRHRMSIFAYDAPTSKGMSRGAALVESSLTHPAWTSNRSGPWLPLRLGDASSMKKLHHVLLDYAPTSDASDYLPRMSVCSYFLFGLNALFNPLAGPEQRNVQQRLQVVFGVPERHFIHRLAAQLAVIHFRSCERTGFGAEMSMNSSNSGGVDINFAASGSSSAQVMRAGACMLALPTEATLKPPTH